MQIITKVFVRAKFLRVIFLQKTYTINSTSDPKGLRY